jgi:hypothetical protein
VTPFSAEVRSEVHPDSIVRHVRHLFSIVAHAERAAP